MAEPTDEEKLREVLAVRKALIEKHRTERKKKLEVAAILPAEPGWSCLHATDILKDGQPAIALTIESVIYWGVPYSFPDTFGVSTTLTPLNEHKNVFGDNVEAVFGPDSTDDDKEKAVEKARKRYFGEDPSAGSDDKDNG